MNDTQGIPVLSPNELVAYAALQRKKKAKVLRRVRRRCFKCWGCTLAIVVALIAILLGILLSIPSEYKTFKFTPNEPPAKKVLVFGASGATGKALMAELLGSDKVEKITSLGRRKVVFPNVSAGPQVTTESGYTKHPKLRQEVIDFRNITRYKYLIEGHDAVFWCLGTTRMKAGSKDAFWKVDHDYTKWAGTVCKEAGIKHFLLLTSIGADADSMLLYSKTKGAIEETIKSLHFERLSIFRPSLLMADREEPRMGEHLAQMIFPHISWTLGGPLRKYREISVEKVAQAMLLTALHSVSLAGTAPTTNTAMNLVEVFESDDIHDLADSEKIRKPNS